VENPNPESKPLTEQELIEKKARDKRAEFEANPDRFVCIDDLVVAAGRSEKGMTMLCNPRGRKEAIQAKGEIDAALTKIILEYDIMVEAERKGNIIPAKGGIMNYARNRIFKK
jgi:hypothetical protein